MSWKIDENKALFSIGAVADILGAKPRMLRLYEEYGLLSPIRSQTNRRLYSLKDINFIAYLNYLSSVKKVNIAGLVEIQKLLMMMGEEERNRFMDQVEREIQNLPKESRQLFANLKDSEIDEAIQEMQSNKPLKEAIKGFNRKLE